MSRPVVPSLVGHRKRNFTRSRLRIGSARYGGRRARGGLIRTGAGETCARDHRVTINPRASSQQLSRATCRSSRTADRTV
jgi:hypothetical protein